MTTDPVALSPSPPGTLRPPGTPQPVGEPQPVGTQRIVRALSIAGSDPSGGAGIQADLKSFAAHGAYGMAAIASLTVQNTRGVRRVHSPPADFLADQLVAITDDIVVDTVKIGMLGTADNIAVVTDWLERHRPEFVVLDPVMVATSGDRLLTADAELAIRALLPLADVLTPNVDELAVLTGDRTAVDLDSAIAQGRRLAAETGARVLVKGGHLAQPGAAVATDAMVTPNGDFVLLPGPLIRTRNTHGTGCSLSSALAALRPQRESWERAAADAKSWLTGALASAEHLKVGSGAGPVNHFHHLWKPAQSPFSLQMWERIAPIRDAIATMPFISALADGTLPWSNFAFYLQQDALYLREYARCLARVAALAPDQDAQIFFAQASAGALEAELSLHRALLADPRSAPPVTGSGPATDAADTSAGPESDGQRTGSAASPVTAGYVDHLHRATSFGDYPEAVAAVLPCFWLYQHIGELIAGRTALPGAAETGSQASGTEAPGTEASGPAESVTPQSGTQQSATQQSGTQQSATQASHPYAAWIATYADPGFAELTRTAIALTDRAAVGASADQRAAMEGAFERSSQYEWMFFAQGTELSAWPV